MGYSANIASDFCNEGMCLIYQNSPRGSKACGHNFFNLLKVLTKFHTRGYLKIKMSHDESVGNVLSWLGNWLRERKQPEPTTLLVTNSICL